MKYVTEFIPQTLQETRPPKLLDQLRRRIRDMHYSMRKGASKGASHAPFLPRTSLASAQMTFSEPVRGAHPCRFEGVARTMHPRKRPTILTPTEINLLSCRLPYATGMRLFDAAQLRIKDADFQRQEITIRSTSKRS